MSMACLDMFNTTDQYHQGQMCPPAMSPRISFSNDFVDPDHMIKHEMIRATTSTAGPISSDFEFSVSNYTMIAADEIFSKGRLLPSKETQKTTTLRDELLHGDDWEDDASSRPPKGPTRWKELLGLKKNHHHHHHQHIAAKKQDKCHDHGSFERVATAMGRPPMAVSGQAAHVNKAAAQELEVHGSTKSGEPEIEM